MKDNRDVSFKEIAEEAEVMENRLGLNIDDILNKLTQEHGEFNDAIQKLRGRYCRGEGSIDDVKGELGDLLFNLGSVCNRVGINPDDFSKFSNNTLEKFKSRVEKYEVENLSEKLKITICGSIAFYDNMVVVKKELESMGHKVDLPPKDLKDEKGDVISVKDYYDIRQTAGDDESWVWERKGEAINWHNKKIDWADVVLVLNYEKNNIKGYVGSNTLMEMGIAFYLGKKIYLLNEIPEVSSKEEILGMQPILLNGKLELIR